jgi:hypothetical protein
VLVEFGLVFAGQDDGFGAQAVGEGIEADVFLGRWSLGACRALRIAAVGPYLLDRRDVYLLCRTMPIWGGRKAI